MSCSAWAPITAGTDHERTLRRRLAEDVARVDRDGERLWRHCCRHAHERGFERGALGLRQIGHASGIREVTNEIVERREGERRLDLCRPGDDDAVSAGGCRRDGPSQRVVLPMPGGPEKSSTPNRCATLSRNGAMAATSRSRPIREAITTARVYSGVSRANAGGHVCRCDG